MSTNITKAFVGNTQLKKGDVINYRITRLGGKDLNPPVIHQGTVITPILPGGVKRSDGYAWVVQIVPKRYNNQLPNWDFGTDITAIYGEDIVEII